MVTYRFLTPLAQEHAALITETLIPQALGGRPSSQAPWSATQCVDIVALAALQDEDENREYLGLDITCFYATITGVMAFLIMTDADHDYEGSDHEPLEECGDLVKRASIIWKLAQHATNQRRLGITGDRT